MAVCQFIAECPTTALQSAPVRIDYTLGVASGEKAVRFTVRFEAGMWVGVGYKPLGTLLNSNLNDLPVAGYLGRSAQVEMTFPVYPEYSPGQFVSIEYGARWLPAEVVAAQPNGLYTVNWEDGTHSKDIPPSAMM